MSKDVSVNKAFAKDEGETHELEEFTGKHLIETGDMGPAEEIEIPAFVTTMEEGQRNQLVGMVRERRTWPRAAVACACPSAF